MEVRFEVTPWVDRREVLDLRDDLFSGGEDGEDRRERGVNKIFAWRLRKQDLPLLLDSTADIVDAILQDERGQIPHNALRLVYASAISRFITGLSDTQTILSRDRPSFFPAGKTIHFPTSLRETRHCIVHRHLPSLAELKLAAKESLEWLWEWYWSHLDAAFGVNGLGHGGTLTEGKIRKRIEGVLRGYVKERKSEIKSRKKEAKAAESALSSLLFVDAPAETKWSVLLERLVQDKMILPGDKKLGSSMSGAFLIWSAFLQALARFRNGYLEDLLESMIKVLSSSARGTIALEVDPVREGLYDWILHIISSNEWQEARQEAASVGKRSGSNELKLVEHVLGRCYIAPTSWTLKLAEELLKEEDLPGRKSWLEMLEAAKVVDGMDIDGEGNIELVNVGEEDIEVGATEAAQELPTSPPNEIVTKSRGPQKRAGLWRPQPIGMIPKGWELDV